MAVPGEGRFTGLQAIINDAAIGARTWRDVTTALRDAFEIDLVTLEIRDNVLGEARALTEDIGARALAEYEERIYHINPRIHVPDPAMYTVYADRHYAERAPTAPEFYDWTARHHLPRWAAGGMVLNDRDHFAVIAMLAFADRGPPDEPTEAAWAKLLPHIGNALQIERSLAQRGKPVELLELAGFETGRAYALLSTDGRVCEASEAFRRLVAASGSLRLGGAGLTAVRASDRDALRRLLGAALGRSAGAIPTSLRVAPVSGGLGLLLRIIPLARGRDIFARLRPAALVVLTDLDAPAAARAEDLRTGWRLTQREAELALLLARGRRLEQAAHELGIGVGTARHHLKSIFSKMDIDRQSDLVRIVCRLAG